MKEEKLERQKKGGLENLPIKKGLILRTSQFFLCHKTPHRRKKTM